VKEGCSKNEIGIAKSFASGKELGNIDVTAHGEDEGKTANRCQWQE
jgi:hypothetical protein